MITIVESPEDYAWFDNLVDEALSKIDLPTLQSNGSFSDVSATEQSENLAECISEKINDHLELQDKYSDYIAEVESVVFDDLTIKINLFKIDLKGQEKSEIVYFVIREISRLGEQGLS